jgi:cytochrome c-type biogenesis protein CcmH/NrfF
MEFTRGVEDRQACKFLYICPMCPNISLVASEKAIATSLKSRGKVLSVYFLSDERK